MRGHARVCGNAFAQAHTPGRQFALAPTRPRLGIPRHVCKDCVVGRVRRAMAARARARTCARSRDALVHAKPQSRTADTHGPRRPRRNARRTAQPTVHMCSGRATHGPSPAEHMQTDACTPAAGLGVCASCLPQVRHSLEDTTNTTAAATADAAAASGARGAARSVLTGSLRALNSTQNSLELNYGKTTRLQGVIFSIAVD